MEKTNIIVNRPLANTFGWLRVNGTALSAAVTAEADVAETLPAGVAAERRAEASYPEIKTGAGAEANALLSGVVERVYTVPAGARPAEALRLRVAFPTGNAGAAVCCELGDGAELTAVMDYAGAAGFAAARTTARIGKNATLRLIQIQRDGETDTFLNDVGVTCAENARFELYRVILGGGATYDGCSVALEGDGSAFEAALGYRLGAGRKLDANYESIHTGKKTDCKIAASGVLSGDAFKLFRGTIDFRTGCSGSTGDEVEDALLLDETVRNQTIPVILCAEEDVAGSHGATIGRLDESLLFYLGSRGMAREAIYDMMARAKLDAVIRKIPDETTRKALLGEEED